MSSSPHASSSSPVPQHDERTSSSSSPCPPPPPLPPTNSDDEVRRLLINTPVCKQVTDEDLDLARQKFELMMTKRVDALVAKINEHRNPLPPPKAKRSPVFDFSRIDVELVRETASCKLDNVDEEALEKQLREMRAWEMQAWKTQTRDMQAMEIQASEMLHMMENKKARREEERRISMEKMKGDTRRM